MCQPISWLHVQALHDPMEEMEELARASGQKGCAFCGGLGHRVADCPKLASQVRPLALYCAPVHLPHGRDIDMQQHSGEHGYVCAASLLSVPAAMSRPWCDSRSRHNVVRCTCSFQCRQQAAPGVQALAAWLQVRC